MSACSSPPPLLVATNQWPGYETLYLARNLGYFDNKQVKLLEYTSATDVMRAFRYKQVDVAALTLDEVLTVAQTEHDLRIILVMDISNGADKVMVDASVRDAVDLQGKCIAVESTALGAYMLHNLLIHADLTLNDITLKHATVDQHQSLLKQQQCDASVTFEPLATELSDQGFHAIFDSSQIYGKIVDVLVTRQHVLKQQSDNLQALMTGHWQSVAYMATSPSDAYQRIAPRLDVTTQELTASYKQLVIPTQQDNMMLLDQAHPDSLYDTIKELSIVLHSIDLLDNIPQLDQLISPSLIESRE